MKKLKKYRIFGPYKREELIWALSLEKAKKTVMKKRGITVWIDFWEIEEC